MSFDSLHAVEQTWIYSLHTLRSPPLDLFFKFLNFFDRTEFFLILIPCIWYFFSPKWGLRLFFLVAVNSMLNGFFKTLFHQPRPLHLDPTLALLPFGSYGFPSGAAQSAVLLPCLLIKAWPHRMAWVIGGVFFFLVSLSRVYLGAHFPSDLLGGWLIGLLLAMLFIRYHQVAETWIEKMDREVALLLSVAILLLFLLISPNEHTFRTVFAALGGVCALFLAQKKIREWPRALTPFWQMLQALLTIFSLFLIYALGMWVLAASFPAHQLVFKAFTYFAVGFTAIYLVPLWFTYLSLSPKSMKSK